jgi:hypothetical protein
LLLNRLTTEESDALRIAEAKITFRPKVEHFDKREKGITQCDHIIRYFESNKKIIPFLMTDEVDF